jgi:molybdopterin-guanine dinucleotide biosynthesis protein A
MHPLVGVKFAAVILAGGRGRRLGGVDKVSLRVHGRSLLERTVDAVPGADPLVVVGPVRPVSARVVWTAEVPAGGGPLAGLHAGLMAVPAQTGLVAVLAADHPYITAETTARLVSAVAGRPGVPGAILRDDNGRPQWLAGVWRIESLRDRMPARVQQRPVRDLLGALDPVRVPAEGAEASDVDTPADWSRVTEIELINNLYQFSVE